MALADRVTARRAADPVTLEEFGYLLGAGRGTVSRTKAGAQVGARSALGLTAWYRGVYFIATAIAGLPVKTYRYSGGVKRLRADPPWLRKPDVEQTWYGLVEAWIMSLLHGGNSLSLKLRSPVGQVTGLREICLNRATPGQAPDGSKRWMIDDYERPFTTSEILHIPGLAYDGRFGLNPIAQMAEPLGLIQATNDYASRFFSNGTNLGGIISVGKGITETEAKDLRREWDAFHQGLLNSHRTGVLSHGATYQRTALGAAESQLLEQRTFGIGEIARALSIPPHKLYELTHATFSNIEHLAIEAAQDTLQPWCERIEAWVNADPDLLPVGNFIEFQLDGRLRGDSVSRANVNRQSVGRPWRTPNEARIVDGLEPMDGGDELMSPLNMGNPGGDPATSTDDPNADLTAPPEVPPA